MMRERGITTLELVVLGGILAVLAAAAAPGVVAMRMQAQRVRCEIGLKDIGGGLQRYASESGFVMPAAAGVPSREAGAPALPKTLGGHVEAGLWRCAADRMEYRRGDGATFASVFAGETTSYEYNRKLGGEKVERWFLLPLAAERERFVLMDAGPFHGSEGSAWARNVLYSDGHVGNMEKMMRGYRDEAGAKVMDKE